MAYALKILLGFNADKTSTELLLIESGTQMDCKCINTRCLCFKKLQF